DRNRSHWSTSKTPSYTKSVSWHHYRKASYQQLAKQNNVSVDDIAKLAGQKLVARAKPGEYVQGINGKWVRKF
ncbi:DUF1318 domain-containing protein, partial [Escherichia coli]|nr:DUF1318 domain-containing protein [Escherichia coli]